jgi:hypothetical protein
MFAVEKAHFNFLVDISIPSQAKILLKEIYISITRTGKISFFLGARPGNKEFLQTSYAKYVLKRSTVL